MNQSNIIRDLTSWLEKNLDQPLSLDRVAKKSGYSKWHLQRMFKEITGQVLGSYIRSRRLTKAAIALRLTSKPILDIALQYRFDSQQTFTRAFKKQFSQTPATFRRSEELKIDGFCPPADVEHRELPVAKFVTLAEKQLKGITQTYECNLEALFTKQTDFRQQFWRDYITQLDTIPPVLYGFMGAAPSQVNSDEHTVFYTAALEPDYVSDNIDAYPVTLPAGEYVQFIYQGEPDGLEDFIITIYTACLTELDIILRSSPDIEIFYLPEDRLHKKPDSVRCEYYVPIRQHGD